MRLIDKLNEINGTVELDKAFEVIKNLPSVTPIIVAHEICNKWGDGCKTSEDGYYYLFEPQESEE